MTLEKAIEFGKIFLKSIENEKGSATYEFVETAVKMMEQEPCEDAISREQAKSAIRDRFKDLPSRVEINTILNELPSVTLQPKTGHWIDKFGGVYRCSCCREIISIDTEIEHPNGITYKYCPSCGSRMLERSE